jgi:hypothetical protein
MMKTSKNEILAGVEKGDWAMKMIKILILSAVAMSAMSMLSAAHYARVIGGYKHLMGKVFVIEGTVKEVIGIDEKGLWSPLSSLIDPIIKLYLDQNPPCQGRVFCGHDGYICYCFHESWLKIMDPDEAQHEMEQQEEVIIWVSPDGTLFSSRQKTYNDADVDREPKVSTVVGS